MMVVHILSPNGRYDQLHLHSARSRVRDVLLRLDGVGDLIDFGEREYSLRIWLDPKLSAYGMTSSDVVQSLRDQNVQVSGGSIGSAATSGTNAFQYTVTTEGRFSDARQFGCVRASRRQKAAPRAIAGCGAHKDWCQGLCHQLLSERQSGGGLGYFSRPGTNALAAADSIRSTMEELKKIFLTG